MTKTNKVVNFIKQNGYYIAFVFCLALLVTVTVALVTSSNSGGTLENGGSEIEEGKNNDNSDENEEQNSPTVSVITFYSPVENGTIIKDYVGASVVYNQTLGVYTGHKAIDFLAEEGANVYCAYDGVVESVTISKVNGTTVTVNHGGGLVTVYNSIEAKDNLFEGMTVSKGEVLGTVSTNNKTESLDGAHLHFEVLENGVKVDPNKYLVLEEK